MFQAAHTKFDRASYIHYNRTFHFPPAISFEKPFAVALQLKGKNTHTAARSGQQLVI
jgi:hypothetical protein